MIKNMVFNYPYEYKPIGIEKTFYFGTDSLYQYPFDWMEVPMFNMISKKNKYLRLKKLHNIYTKQVVYVYGYPGVIDE